MKKIISVALVMITILSISITSISCGLSDKLKDFLNESVTESLPEENNTDEETSSEVKLPPMPEYEGVELYRPFAEAVKQYAYPMIIDGELDYCTIRYGFNVDAQFVMNMSKKSYTFGVLYGELSSFESIITNDNTVHFYQEKYLDQINFLPLEKYETGDDINLNQEINRFSGEIPTCSEVKKVVWYYEHNYVTYNADEPKIFILPCCISSDESDVIYSNFSLEGDYRKVDYDKYSYSLKSEIERVVEEGKFNPLVDEYNFNNCMDFLYGTGFDGSSVDLNTYKAIEVGDSLNSAILYHSDNLLSMRDFLKKDLASPLYTITASNGSLTVDLYISKNRFVAEFKSTGNVTLNKSSSIYVVGIINRVDFETWTDGKYSGEWRVVSIDYDKTHFSSIPVYVLR